jgi:NAD(P)-dependent dehydrogenase (short-subunit alcohol dehydrogenase family)
MAFTGKVFVVTGGNSGIGYDAARHLTEQGAKVYITGRNAEAVKKSAAALGRNAIGIVANAASISDSANLAEEIAANGDKLDGYE